MLRLGEDLFSIRQDREIVSFRAPLAERLMLVAGPAIGGGAGPYYWQSTIALR